MICKSCQSNQFYQLKNDYIKCKNCSKKYSLKKLKLDEQIIDSFIANKNALQVSKDLELNYRTVKNRYDFYRLNLTSFLNDIYNESFKQYSEYEEKRVVLNKNKDLFIDVMAFTNGNSVYSILMPNFSSTSAKKKIYSNKFYETKLYDFWLHLNENLKQYKGINQERIVLYIKEYEFKFNYNTEEQKEILSKF